MHTLQQRRTLRSWPGRLALLAALTGAPACGPPTGGLHGFVPPAQPNVDRVSLPEVFEGRPSAPFRMVAPRGHVLFVYFGYVSCPDVCPTTLADLRAALRELGRDAGRVEVAFVTVDVRRDSAAVLGPYLASFVPGAHALRAGNEEQLSVAERAFGASSQVTRDAAGQVVVSHTGTSYLVDDTGRIRLEWSFGTSPHDIARDLRSLLRGERD